MEQLAASRRFMDLLRHIGHFQLTSTITEKADATKNVKLLRYNFAAGEKYKNFDKILKYFAAGENFDKFSYFIFEIHKNENRDCNRE